jgi:hypothetical protein
VQIDGLILPPRTKVRSHTRDDRPTNIKLAKQYAAVYERIEEMCTERGLPHFAKLQDPCRLLIDR